MGSRGREQTEVILSECEDITKLIPLLIPRPSQKDTCVLSILENAHVDQVQFL